MGIAAQIGDRFKIEFIAKAISVVSGALVAIVLARILQPDSYGILFLALSILGTLNLFSKLGISKSGARYLSEYKETDQRQVPGIILTAFLYVTITSIIVGVSLFVTRRLVSGVLNEPSLVPFLTIGILYIAFTTYTSYVRRILQGLEDIKPAAAVHAIESGSRLVFAVGLVVLGFGALGALGGYILSSFVGAAVGCYYIYTRYIRDGAGLRLPGENLPRRIAEYSLPLTATRSADVLDKRVDTILVGFFLNPAAVSFYVIGKQVAGFLQSPASALGFTVSPTYSSLQTEGNTDKAATMLEESITYILLLYIPAAAGLILVAEPMVRFVFGVEYIGATPVVQLLALYAVLHAVASLISNGLDYLGKAKVRAAIKITTSVSNAILNVILIPRIGVVGAAIATVVTFGIYIVANLYIMHLEFDLNGTYILGRLSKILIITVLMSLPVYGILSYTVSILTLTTAVVAGVVVWAALSTTIGWVDPQRIAAVVR